MTLGKESLSATGLNDTISRGRAQRVLLMLLVVALVFRIMVIFADNSLGVLAQPDIAMNHHVRALALGQAWLDGRFLVSLSELTPQLKTSIMRVVVAYFLAPFYAVLSPITGSSPIPGRIGVAIYSLGFGGLAYALVREIRLDERSALLAATVALFWPSVVYRSVLIQREVFVALATLTAVWIGVRWTRSASVIGWSSAIGTVALVVVCAVLLAIRPENLLVVVAVLTVSAVVRYHEHGWAIAGVFVLAIGGAVYAVTNLGTFIAGRAALRGVGLTPHTLDVYAHARAHGDTAYLTWLHYDSWLDVVLFAPLKVVYFLGSPMVWSVSDPAGILAGMSGVALLVVSVFAIYGAVCVFRGGTAIVGKANRQAAIVLATFLVVGVGAYSVIEMNGGAAFRRRIEFVPAILVFATVGFSGLWNRIAARRATTTSELATDSENTILAESE